MSDVDLSGDGLLIPIDWVTGARGHGVLAVGADSDGGEALAVWRLSATGRAGGAWVLRFDDIERNSDPLVRIVCMLRDRCLIGWATETTDTILDRIGYMLPVQLISSLKGNVLAIPDSLKEISEERDRYAEAVERHRAMTKSKIAPLAWPAEVPDWNELAERTARRAAAASPVATAALALTSAVAATAQLWEDTEQARYRRSYLRSLGEPQLLPPRWLARLREAVDSSAATPV